MVACKTKHFLKIKYKNPLVLENQRIFIKQTNQIYFEKNVEMAFMAQYQVKSYVFLLDEVIIKWLRSF